MKSTPVEELVATDVSWLGDMPKRWRLTRLQDHAVVVAGYPFDSKLFDPERGMPLIRIRDISSSSTVVRFTGNVPPHAVVASGDVLIGMDGDFNVAWWNAGEAALNQRVACLRARTPAMQRFLFYALPFHLNIVNDLTYFTTVKHLSNTDILRTRFALPSGEEVALIARFLDYETAKIDALIEKQQQLIALLKEKRQAVISHAVTKGLDPAAPMKDSGVEWLGEVPAHWTVAKLARFIRVGSGEFISNSEFTAEKTDNRVIPVVGGNGVSGWGVRANSPAGTVVIGRVGALCGNVHLLNEQSWVTDNALRVEFSDRFHAAYLAAILRVRNLNDLADKSAQPLITGGRVKTQSVPVPSLQEQAAIVEHLVASIPHYDGLESRAEQATTLLQERRTALISAAVTGKIDVRGWEPPAGHEEQLA